MPKISRRIDERILTWKAIPILNIFHNTMVTFVQIVRKMRYFIETADIYTHYTSLLMMNIQW